jgi:hypothetical protein
MSPIKQAIIIPRFIRISFFGLLGVVILVWVSYDPNKRHGAGGGGGGGGGNDLGSGDGFVGGSSPGCSRRHRSSNS